MKRLIINVETGAECLVDVPDDDAEEIPQYVVEDLSEHGFII